MFSGISRRLGILALGMLCLTLATTARAGGTNVTVQAQLVWGTNLKESSSKDHKPVDSKTAEGLRNAFKWQNYFVIKSEAAELTQGKLYKLKMSEKCTLELKFVGHDKFEVVIVGKGERLAKGTQSMPPGEKVVLGGINENESSWLIIIKQKKDQ